MSQLNCRARSALALVIGGLSLCAAQSHATVLTFDMGAVDNQSVDALYQSYGDRVGNPIFDALAPTYSYGSACGITPNVSVTYLAGTFFGISQPPSQRRFGDLNNVIWRTFGGNNILGVTLTADPGFEVQLFSFDIAALLNLSNIALSENLPAKSIIVYNQMGTVLFRDPNPANGPLPIIPAIDGAAMPTHRTYDFATLTGGPLVGQTIQLFIDVGQISSKIDRFGLDNIKFGQNPPGIPAPAGLGLVALTGLLAARRRRG